MANQFRSVKLWQVNFLLELFLLLITKCNGINHNTDLFAFDYKWLMKFETSEFQVICTAQKQTIIFQTPKAQHILHL